MAQRILIIDDDENILEILNTIFKNEGYDVVISNTAEAAYQAANKVQEELHIQTF